MSGNYVSSLTCLSLAADGPLPEYVIGEYKYESSENYEEFLTDLGNHTVPYSSVNYKEFIKDQY